MPIMIPSEQLGYLNELRSSVIGLNGRETLKLGTDASIQKGGLLSRLASGVVRRTATKTANNEIRTALLVNLGTTLGLDGLMARNANGTVVFHADFMDQLKAILGDEVLKSSDFALNANGEVASGKPLTARRVSAIVNAVDRLATPALRLDVAVKNVTDRIYDIVTDKSHVMKDRARPLIEKYGKTRAEIAANVRTYLESNKYFMDFVNLEHLSDEFVANLKAAHMAEIENGFKRTLGLSENNGFDWEMVRCGQSRRYEVAKVNGQTIASGKVAKTVPGFKAARAALKVVQGWDQSFSPFHNKSTADLCAALKALIPNNAIRKVVTRQLGLQGVSTSLGVTSDLPKGLAFDPGNGHDLVDLVTDSMTAGVFCCKFSTDALSQGSTDVTVKDGQVVITQKFNFGPQLDMLGDTALSKGAYSVNMPLFTAVSTIVIPLDQNPAYGEMPRYTADLQIENTIAA